MWTPILAGVAASRAAGPGNYVRLSVSDTGKGMDRATMNRIFELFFTTKGPGRRHRVGGLSVVHGIMQGHDGAYFTVYSQPGEGTTFHLYFPALSGEVSGWSDASGIHSARSGQRILVVDDGGSAREARPKNTRSAGPYVVETKDPAPRSARISVRAGQDQFDLVITDTTMPIMSGIALAQQPARFHPGLPVILTTGYPAASSANSFEKWAP